MFPTCIAQYNPDIPDWIIRSPLADFLASNADDDEVCDAARSLSVGDAVAIGTGGGCFVVLVGEGENYSVACTEGQYHGLHHSRPEPICYTVPKGCYVAHCHACYGPLKPGEECESCRDEAEADGAL